jgi:hypothetical protein
MSIKQELQSWVITHRARRLKLERFDFPASLQGANKVVVTLPEGIHTNSLLLRMVGELPVVFPSSELLIVVPVGCTEVSRKTGIHAMSPDLYSNNWIGLPKRSFLVKVKNYAATIAIDFETRKNIFNAMVMLASGAAIRVGLSGVWDMPIHNVQIKAEYATDELKIYRSFVDIISQIQLESVMFGLES